MRHVYSIIVSILTIAAVAAAACSSDGASTAGDLGPTADDAAGGESDGLVATVDSGWSATVIGEGSKPVLALDGAGSPAVAYLAEDIGGYIAYAAARDGWLPDRLVEGYFYGPIGLAFDPEDRPNIVYHDHQAAQFDEALGDLAYAVREGGNWAVTAVEDDGHDGWDSTIAIGDDGAVRAAGVDPAQFRRTDGVEFYELRDGAWSVTPVGSGPIRYEFNVSLAIAPDGNPALTYDNDRDGDLVFASFDGASWNLETVASDGDVGKFSSLAFDASGRPHVSFFEDRGGSDGRVLYATPVDDGWMIEEVGSLDRVRQGMSGARRITSLALDGSGVPHVAFSDEGAVRYATRGEARWEVEEIVNAGERPLGQLVSLALDGASTPHLAFFEVTSSSPLNGLIVYLTAV